MHPVQPIINVEQKRECRFNWARLIMSTLIPLTLGIYTVVYSIQQDKLTKINREQELSIARDNRAQDLIIAEEEATRDVDERKKLRMQIVYDSYIAEISRFTLKYDFNRSDANQLMHIRMQTLNALYQLDLDQKREVIVFLYENGLIRADSSSRVNLRGADLTGVKFVRSGSFPCELSHLYLAEVSADNILFNGCRLTRSVFKGASLNGATFFKCFLSSSNYEGADMVQAVFNASNIFSSNFASADLRNASFDHHFQQMNFTNTDLFGSKVLDLTGPRNVYVNTRLPDGSFSEIDTKELLSDGGAEIMNCNGSSKNWLFTNPHFRLYIAHKNYNNGSIQGVRGNCFFQFTATSEAYQDVDARYYSRFIDSSQAWCKMVAYMMCRSAQQDDQAYVRLNFNTKEFVYSPGLSKWIKSVKGDTSLRGYYVETKIPPETRWLTVRIGANITASTPITNQTNECYIDDVRLFIFKLNDSSIPVITTTQNPNP